MALIISPFLEADTLATVTGRDATTTTPVALTISSSSDALRVTQTGSGNALLIEDAANPDSSPFVIDNTGREILGYTATLDIPNYAGNTFTPSRQQIGLAGATVATMQALFVASNYGVSNVIAKSRGATVGDYTTVVSGDRLYVLDIKGADGTGFVRSADISAYVDGTPATTSVPGRLVFSTTAVGGTSPAERMRITSTGAIAINGATNYGTAGQVLTSQGDAAPAWTNAPLSPFLFMGA